MNFILFSRVVLSLRLPDVDLAKENWVNPSVRGTKIVRQRSISSSADDTTARQSLVQLCKREYRELGKKG